MEVSIEKVSNGYIVKKYAIDEFKEEDVVLVALSFDEVVYIIREHFCGSKSCKTSRKEDRDMTKD